ncbi:hypothetical protein GCM10010264_51250 [Streptomyces globisporus]|nr:hypothetical protein GCM10010264_51250 [Streptomyces globisporus]
MSRDLQNRPAARGAAEDLGHLRASGGRRLAVGGNPASLIRTRYEDADIARLLAVAWWAWPAEHLTRHIRTVMSGTVAELEAAAPGAVQGGGAIP